VNKQHPPTGASSQEVCEYLYERVEELKEAKEKAQEALTELLEAFVAFTKEANWGESALSANTIRQANEAPGKARKVLHMLGEIK
jgi:prefoldin subunit 5